MSEIRLILSFSVSGRGRLMMVLGIYIRAIKRSSINCRAQNVLLTCTFPARKRCKNTFRSVMCAVGDGWVGGCRSAPGWHHLTGQSPGPWVGYTGDAATHDFLSKLGGLHRRVGHGAGSPAPAGPCGAADPGTGRPALGSPPCTPRQPQGATGAGSCARSVLKLIEH